MIQNQKFRGWEKCTADIFWGEIAPCDHVLQIYENETIFVDSLAGFVGAGIKAGDTCIIIATDSHLKALIEKLESFGVKMDMLISENKFIPLNAEETLSKFMVNDWPDEELFNKTIMDVISQCSPGNRRIRAFGEMVAILWAKGLNGATVQLEHLWNKFCEKYPLSLFCAYPKSGSTGDINATFRHVCTAHSKMIDGSKSQLTEIQYLTKVAV